MTTLQPQTRIGDYELVRLLGCGGMGDVWMASDTRADRSVALKFIKPHLLDDAGFRSRFLNEARTLGRLEHDRIVTLYNVVENGTNLALVLRFIDGESLADKIDTDGILPLTFVLACARDILPALGFAHEHGVIHRDIKPQNILLDRKGRAFLTDFGIAVGDFAERSTMTGMAVGTPHYMSPEQIQTPRAVTSAAGGHRSDIYSFGIVLFEMLTGRVPFGGDTGPDEFYRVQHSHCVDAPPSLRECNPEIQPAIDEVVLRCLAKDPNERPQTCLELLEALESAVGSGMAPVARPRRAATVFEGAPVVSPPAPTPAPGPSKPRQKSLPKSVWLLLGGVVIAASIGYGILTKPEGQPETIKKQDSSGQETAIDPDSAKRAVESYQRALEQQKQGQPCAAQQAVDQAVSLDNKNPDYKRLQQSMTKECQAQRQAAGLAEQGQLATAQGRHCDAATLYGRAITLQPANAAFRTAQEASSKACGGPPRPIPGNGKQFYDQAQNAYREGKYCEAKSLSDQAVQLEPANAEYLKLQNNAAKGCNANVE